MIPPCKNSDGCRNVGCALCLPFCYDDGMKDCSDSPACYEPDLDLLDYWDALEYLGGL